MHCWWRLSLTGQPAIKEPSPALLISSTKKSWIHEVSRKEMILWLFILFVLKSLIAPCCWKGYPKTYMTETTHTPYLLTTWAFQKRSIRQRRPKVSRTNKTLWIQKGQHAMLKRFLRANLGFNRDDIQDYLNFFFITSNPEEESWKRSRYCWNWFSIIRKSWDIGTKTVIPAQNQGFSPTRCNSRLFFQYH